MGDPRDPRPNGSDRNTGTDELAFDCEPTLPSRLRDFIGRTGDSLARAYKAADSASDENQSHTAGFENPWAYYDSEKEHILDHADINYWLEGTGRIVAAIGPTFDGDLVFENRSGLVVKFQPWLSLDGEKYRAMQDDAMNVHEIQVWEEACKRDDTDLFASIFEHSESAHWIAMEQCVPIYPSGPPHNAPCHDYISDRPEKGLTTDFRDRFTDRGWYEHDLKHGNIGENMNGTTVLLDYGSFTEYTG